jgi:hypothetical protein
MNSVFCKDRSMPGCTIVMPAGIIASTSAAMPQWNSRATRRYSVVGFGTEISFSSPSELAVAKTASSGAAAA